MNCRINGHCCSLTALTWLTFLCVVISPIIASAQTTSQAQLLKRGVFHLELLDIQETTNIVPPLTDDEGIMLLIIDPSIDRFFTRDEILSWVRTEQFVIQNIRFKPENVNRRPDGSISIRFEFRFLPNTSKIVRSVQIENVKDFDIYYEKHEFHQKRMVSYRLKIKEQPVYDAPRTGRFIIEANEADFTLELTDPGNTVRRFTIPTKSDTLSLTPGRYDMSLTKPNFYDLRFRQSIVADSTYTYNAIFRPVQVANLPMQIVPARKSRWWLWTLIGATATTSAAYFFLRTDAQLPAPPGPPSN